MTLDSSWSGNLFDYDHKVIRKLYDELKIPFVLEGDRRKDDSPVHEALREALVNTLVHADYSERLSVLVVKRPDLFGFRNPGLMRLPVRQALEGGESDCRNRALHQMFHLIGLGERSGFGIPKILEGWASQHWRQPRLYERNEPANQTLLELRMIDLIPEPIIAMLRNRFGHRFDRLDQTRRMILVTAAMEETINHARISEITDLHPHDLTRAFQDLVSDGLLESNSTVSRQGRGTVYFLPGADLPTPEEVFAGPGVVPTGPGVSPLGPGVSPAGPGVAPLGPGVSPVGPGSGGLVPGENLITSLSQLRYEQIDKLNAIARPAQEKKHLPREKMNEIILSLCKEYHLSMRVLTVLLKRTEDRLRKAYLNPMVKAKCLGMAFPKTPNHPDQAYRVID